MADGRPIGECYWVEHGRVLAGEYPGHWDPVLARRRVGAFLDAGVRRFIDLTHPDDPIEPYKPLLLQAAGAKGVSADYCSFPIRDMGVPESAAAMTAILESVRAAYQEDQRIYVHCWGGVGRTGVVVGCWLVECGLSGEAALAELARRFVTMDKASRFRASPQTWEQVGWIRSWTPRLGMRPPPRTGSHAG